MRKFITLLAVAICSVVGASAQCSTENKVVPAEGETLKYGAYFNWGAIWVKGGEAIFKAEHVGNYLHFAVSAYSMPKWRWIYGFTLSAFKKSMEGIYTSTVSQDTLDECPMAYKDPQSIIAAIGDTVQIEKQIRPIYNFKSSDRFTSKKKR